ncbi:MAG: NAD-binding protein [Gammaproteobacteria bacterium]|nr:NAD-binding protein [Gammaproteobacteria bacterium]
MPSATSDLDRVSAIVLQLMRGPILVLLCVYAIGITGMALMPGVDSDGNPASMNLFHAFYFFTYTATTTGFGEIPHAFTDEQRLWATVCLYMGVVAWLYAISSIIRLALHPELLRAIAERRFARAVDRIDQPFFVLCGFGDTGSLLARGLSDHMIRAAVLDADTERIKALRLRDYRVRMPGLCADASTPRHLIDAGVQHPQCRAVVVLTGHDDINLKIAVMTRFLNPRLRIICRDTDASHRELLATVGDVTLVSPFDVFAQQLNAAIHAPLLRAWEDWLVGDASVDLERPVCPPRGNWVLCGYGRMGQALHARLKAHTGEISVIDRDEGLRLPSGKRILGHVDRNTLTAANLVEAVGLVAGTSNDEENLRVLLSARTINPQAFLIVRQNHHENELAFNAADANLIMQPSLVLARHILLYLLMPSLGELLRHLQACGADAVAELVQRAREQLPRGAPLLWTQDISALDCVVPGCREAAGQVRLRHLLRDPAHPDRDLDALPLVVSRADQRIMLPDMDFVLQPGDALLLCGTRRARQLLRANVLNPYTLHRLVTGEDPPRSWFFQWLYRQRAPGSAAEAG